jgi:NADH-quinone oxidoreductase subunit K
MWFTAYPLAHFLAVSAIVFALGVYILMTRKNAVSLLMGIELMMNSANINFIAFARYSDVLDRLVEGPLFALFVSMKPIC